MPFQICDFRPESTCSMMGPERKQVSNVPHSRPAGQLSRLMLTDSIPKIRYLKKNPPPNSLHGALGSLVLQFPPSTERSLTYREAGNYEWTYKNPVVPGSRVADSHRPERLHRVGAKLCQAERDDGLHHRRRLWHPDRQDQPVQPLGRRARRHRRRRQRQHRLRRPAQHRRHGHFPGRPDGRGGD